MKKAAIIVGVILVVFGVVGLMLPSKQHVERSITINVEREVAFDLANDLEKFVQYSPFGKEDPTMKIEWGATRAGAGASYSWDGEKMGAGSMRIAESRRPEFVGNDLDFKKEGKATGFFRFEKVDGGTKVTWGYDGDAGMHILRRYMGFFMMDKFLGGYFEKGLASMKQMAESQKDTKKK